jgi:hypothetical protein
LAVLKAGCGRSKHLLRPHHARTDRVHVVVAVAVTIVDLLLGVAWLGINVHEVGVIPDLGTHRVEVEQGVFDDSRREGRSQLLVEFVLFQPQSAVEDVLMRETRSRVEHTWVSNSGGTSDNILRITSRLLRPR